MKKLKELMNDPANTIELQFLKLYFIGPSGLGKTTTRQRLTQVIMNLSEKQPQRCSTHLAECSQCLAVVKGTQTKLSLKTSENIDEEMQMLYAYAKEKGKSSSSHQSRGRVQCQPFSLKENEDRQIVALQSHSKISLSDVQDMISKFQTTVGSRDYEDLERISSKLLLNLVDIGGQPGFLEMLPFLSKGPGMFLAFFPLWKELGDLYEVSYEREEDRITPYEARYTIDETLCQILSAINHYVGFSSTPLPKELEQLSNIDPVVSLVGTFKDKLELQTKAEVLQIRENLSGDFPAISSDKIESEIKYAVDVLSDKNKKRIFVANSPLQVEIHRYLTSKSTKEVKRCLEEKLKRKEEEIDTITRKFKHIIKHPGNMKFFSVDNVSDKDSDLDPLRSHLKVVFDTFFRNATVRIHPNQLFLGVVLRKEFVIVSLYDCIQIGRELKMDKEEIEFTLWYLSECVGALIYHPEVKDAWFRQNIICNPQVIFDSISSLIVKPLLAIHSDDAVSHENEAESWKYKGQFSLAMIKRCHTEECNKKVEKGKLIPVDSLVKFLEHSNILAPIPTKNSKGVNKDMYFIPAILECATRDTLLNPPPTDDDTPYPIKITFEPRYVPIGLFCAMVSRLVSRGREREGILGMKWELTESDHPESSVKRNLVCFRVDSAEHIVTLIAHVDCLELRLIRQDRSIPLHDLCSYVLSTVLFIMKEINNQISPIIAFDCRCDQQHDQSNKLCCLVEGRIPSVSFKCNGRNVSLQTNQECWIAKVSIIMIEIRLLQLFRLPCLLI